MRVVVLKVASPAGLPVGYSWTFSFFIANSPGCSFYKTRTI